MRVGIGYATSKEAPRPLFVHRQLLPKPDGRRLGSLLGLGRNRGIQCRDTSSRDKSQSDPGYGGDWNRLVQSILEIR